MDGITGDMQHADHAWSGQDAKVYENIQIKFRLFWINIRDPTIQMFSESSIFCNKFPRVASPYANAHCFLWIYAERQFSD